MRKLRVKLSCTVRSMRGEKRKSNAIYSRALNKRVLLEALEPLVWYISPLSHGSSLPLELDIFDVQQERFSDDNRRNNLALSQRPMVPRMIITRARALIERYPE